MAPRKPSVRKQKSPSQEEPHDAAHEAAALVQQAPGDAITARTTSESMASEPSEEDIRLRAYHMYLERGGGDGSDFDDWLKAEEQLRNRKDE
jgi:hypothetical protein